MRSVAIAIFAVMALVVPVSAQPAAPATVPVGTVSAEKKPIAKKLDFVGRVDAINRVQVKARVTGYLEAVLFTEGDRIAAGASLYQIEKGLFQAAVKQAEGALERAKSAKVLTTVQLQRAVELLQKNTGTVVARDQATAADQQAQGAIYEAEANLQTAQINLGYTDIVAPIAGKIGRTNITKGNVVGPDSGVLTTIVSQDPMYVTFPVSQRDFLQRRQSGVQPSKQSVKVRLRYSDGSFYDQVGEIDFVDVTVDRATDTVLVRAVMPNPKGSLVDGQLMRVVVESGAPVEKIVIPQAALIADQAGIYVFVAADGKAEVKRVKLGGESGTDVVIDDGLSPGDLVIVEGLQNLRQGVAVRASPMPRTLSGG